MKSGDSVELLIHAPRLLSPAVGSEVLGELGRDLPPLPAMELILARARIESGRDRRGEDAVAADFGTGCDRSPVGPVSRYGDAGVTDTGYYLRAEPVHLRPDRDSLVAFDARVLDILPEEAAELATAFNEHFAADGLHLAAVTPHRWYLRLEGEPDFDAPALDEVVGGRLDTAEPTGRDALWLQRVLNETQMLFHRHAVNQARERADRPMINGIWPWGGGRLAQRALAPRVESVFSDEPYARGLARLAGLTPRARPAALEDWLARRPSGRGPSMVVLDAVSLPAAAAELDAWAAELEAMEKHWFEPLLVALKEGQVRSFELVPSDGRRYRVAPGRLRRFWRLRKPLVRYLSGAGE